MYINFIIYRNKELFLKGLNFFFNSQTLNIQIEIFNFTRFFFVTDI